MKGSIRVKSVLFFFLFVGSLVAQPKYTITNNPKFTGSLLLKDEDCSGTISVTVDLTNLDYFAPSGTGISEYFPTSHPTMYLRYVVGPLSGYVLLENFYLLSSFATYNLYQAYVSIPYNLCNYCEGSPMASVNIELGLMQLLDSKNGTYEQYPACNFIDSGDIFSCEHFVNHVSCKSGICSNSALTLTTGSFIVRCEKEALIRSAKTELIIRANPNPFVNYVEIHIDETETYDLIQLSDIHGRVLYDYKNVIGTETIVLHFDTDNFEPGVYFLRVLRGKEYLIKKLIKVR